MTRCALRNRPLRGGQCSSSGNIHQTYSDSNEKDSGTGEETIHVKTLPDGVPPTLVICVQSELASLRQGADDRRRGNLPRC